MDGAVFGPGLTFRTLILVKLFLLLTHREALVINTIDWFPVLLI